MTNARAACKALAPLALEHELVISHGNGPQVGLLALQGSAYTEVEPYPLDVLGAQTEGMIGYLIQQELGNELPLEKRLASLLTLIEVDRDDPAFGEPDEADRPDLRRGRRRRGSRRRRAGRSSPTATASAGSSRRRCRSGIFGIEPVEWLLDSGCVVICAGGGGIPVMYTDEPAPAGRQLVGVEAVIDKDLASALLAADLHADALADRHRRRRGLRRLGHAGPARDPPGDAGGARRDASSPRARWGRRCAPRARSSRRRAASPRSARSSTRPRCSAARPAPSSRSTPTGIELGPAVERMSDDRRHASRARAEEPVHASLGVHDPVRADRRRGDRDLDHPGRHLRPNAAGEPIPGTYHEVAGAPVAHPRRLARPRRSTASTASRTRRGTSTTTTRGRSSARSTSRSSSSWSAASSA